MKKFKAAVIGCGRAGSLFDLENKRQIIAITNKYFWFNIEYFF